LEEKVLLLKNCWKDLFLLRLVQNYETFQDAFQKAMNGYLCTNLVAQALNTDVLYLQKFLVDGISFQLSDFEFTSLNTMKLFNYESITGNSKLKHIVEVLHHQTCEEYVDRSEMFRGSQSEVYTNKVLHLKSQLQLVRATYVQLVFFGPYYMSYDGNVLENLIRTIIKVSHRTFIGVVEAKAYT
ncbi:Nuclear receptor subfamily 0 group B member 2, partial [Orchesella cincta]